MISIGVSTFDVFYPFLAPCSPLLLAQSAELFRLETGPFYPGGLRWCAVLVLMAIGITCLTLCAGGVLM